MCEKRRKDENNMKDEYVAYVGTYTHGSSIGIHLYDVNVEEAHSDRAKSHTGQQLFPHCPFLKRQIPVFDCR